MIRIVGIQRSNHPSEEFVILQNQGSLRIQLRGHVLVSELAVATGSFSAGAFIFSDDALIPAGMFVLLATGEGESRWLHTTSISRASSSASRSSSKTSYDPTKS